jgi:hypothetical protein
VTGSDAEAIATALGGWRNQRPTKGRRGWLCRCPSHDDRGPSLSIANGTDGRLLLHCFSGCGFAEIRDALVQRGLLEANDNRPRRKPRPFRVSPGDLLMLANIVEDDRALSAAWRTGHVEFFVSRLVALRRGCAGPNMQARCCIINLGSDLTAFARALLGGGLQ